MASAESSGSNKNDEQMKSIILFLPEYRKGSLFENKIVDSLSTMDVETEIVFVKKNVNPLQQQQFLYASYVADVVIVDCTIPKDKNDGGVYPVLTAQINVLNHVIVVSETPLPLNITPYRHVAPDDNKTLELHDLAVRLIDCVSSSIEEDTYRRLPSEDFLKDMAKFQRDMENMMGISLQNRQRKNSDIIPVMISYRNSHSEEVEKFKEIITDESEAGKAKRFNLGLYDTYNIKVLPPASLCGQYEAHTPMRRWMLVGLLEDHIRDVKEVWVYESRNSKGQIDYTNSWWTIAEMIMVANINYDRADKIKVRVYNPTTNSFYESTPEKYLIEISDDQHNKLARYLSNTRPDTMGPETLDQIRQLTQIANFLRSKLIPKALKNQMLENMKANFELAVPSNMSAEERKYMVDNMMSLYSNPDEIDKYVKDDVFQESFWNDISYQTSETTPCFKCDRIDVDVFISIPMDELTDYKIMDFKKASKRTDRTISINGKAFKIEKAEADRYLWLATRMGKPTIKDDNAPGIECIPIFNVKSIQ